MKINFDFKKKDKPTKILLISLLLLVGYVVIFAIALHPNKAVAAPDKEKKIEILVVYNGDYDNFLRSLKIDDSFEIDKTDRTSKLKDADDYDVVVLLDPELDQLDNIEINNLTTFIKKGGGLFLVCGPNLEDEPYLLENLTILEKNPDIEYNDEEYVLTPKDEEHEISTKIEWNSAPDLKDILILHDLNDSVDVIIKGYPISKNLEKDKYKTLIFGEHNLGKGKIAIFTALMEDVYNKEFKLWPYFNYFLYGIIQDNQGEDIPEYHKWEYSPVPHLFEQILLSVYVAIVSIVAILLFLTVRRRSKLNPIEEKSPSENGKELEKMEKKEPPPIILPMKEFEILEIEEVDELEKKAKVDLKDEWEQIGTHRQISGFFFSFFLGLLIVMPQLVVTTFIIPRYVQPYPQASGYYNFAYQFFQAIWMVFDVGTSFALAKYFAQYRVKDPDKAIHYIQIFVWWQILTGMLQIILIALIGSIIFPQTNMAHMTWIFISYSLVQYPGFFLVFIYIFQGQQRGDLQLVGFILYAVVLNLIGQIIFILIFREWGRMNPIYGEALGAGIGYAFGAYFAEWSTFFITMFFFKKQGFSVKRIFRADFLKLELNEALSYGVKLMIGNVWVPAVWLFQMVLIAIYVPNYSNELGYYNLAYSLVIIISFLSLFTNSLLGGFSEAYEHNRPNLVKLYIYQGFKWCNYLAFFLVAVLLATGDLFILGAAGPTWARSTYYLGFLIIFQLLGPYSWIGDATFEGTGKTLYAGIAWIIEQMLRAVLLLILLMNFNNMIFVIIAYIPALIIKNIFVWILIKKKISDYKLYPWTSFIAPGIAAVITYALLRFVSLLVWEIPLGDKIINVLLLFVVGIFIFINFYTFLTGFFGGFDNNTLKEFERAAAMLGGVGKLTKILYKVTYASCKISPFYNRFKVKIFETAMNEAYTLTLEKEKLII